MIAGNIVIFGLGTVGADIFLDRLSLKELRLGRYKVGEKTFREDKDYEIKMKLHFNNSHREVQNLIDNLNKLRNIKQSERIMSINCPNGNFIIFDFTRGENSIKSINVVISWLDQIWCNIMFFMAC